MKNRSNFWIYALLLMGALFVFAISCQKDDDIEQEPVTEDPVTSIAENAVVINNTDWENSIISQDTVNNTYSFNDNINDLNLEIGDIIVSDSDEGILRKVSGISNEEGTIIVQTDDADLEDVIENGEFDIEQPLTVSDLNRVDYHYKGISLNPSCLKQANNTNFLWNINTVIHDADGNANTTNDQIRLEGQFSCSWDINMNVKIGWWKVKKITAGFEATENLDLTLLAGIGFDFEKSITLMTVNFNTITVWVGSLPVVIKPVLEINVGIEGFATANITTSVTQGLHFEAGIEYNRDSGWSNNAVPTPTYTYEEPQLNVETEVVAYLGPKLILKIYGVKGPFVDARLYGKLVTDLPQEESEPWWTFYAGLDLGAGVRVEKFGTLFDYRIDQLIFYEVPIAWSSTPAPEKPTVLTTPITNITETSASGGGNITDEGDSSVTEHGVCWIDVETTGQTTPTIEDNSGLTAEGAGTGTGNFVSSMSGLIQNTMYNVRAYATNSAGIAYGDIISFNTLSTPAIPQLLTSDIIGVTETTAVSGGYITDDGGVPVIARGVCWSAVATGQTPTIDDNHTTDVTEEVDFVSNISDLTPNTRYNVRAYATNSVGTGYGPSKEFTTDGGTIVVTLNEVDTNTVAYETWNESGVILSLQEHNGQTAFGINSDGIWLYPAMLHADLSQLQGTIINVVVEINDGCGQNCTVAKLFDGDVEIDEDSNTSTGESTLTLTNDGNNIPDILTVTSSEGKVLNITIELEPN